MYAHGMIAPVVALILWSLIVLIWLYARRIPAMLALKINPERFRDPAARDLLPDTAQRVAANYNHLMEQPTLFYAVCFVLQFLDQAHPINIGLAWTYVALRIVHSLVQSTVNIIRVRFFIFVAASVVLASLAIHAAFGIGMFEARFYTGG